MIRPLDPTLNFSVSRPAPSPMSAGQTNPLQHSGSEPKMGKPNSSPHQCQDFSWTNPITNWFVDGR